MTQATAPRGRRPSTRFWLFALLGLVVLVSSATPLLRRTGNNAQEVAVDGQPLVADAVAEVNVSDLAALEARTLATEKPPLRVLVMDELEEPEEPAPPAGAVLSGPAPTASEPQYRLFAASPSPTQNYPGLDDIAMVDSNYIVIPPDLGGAVGPTKVMESFNNNYQIRDKATGATQLTLGTATFWAPVVPAANRAQLTDPRTTYDPYNNRWIAVMQTVNANGFILLGVSQTSDPAGTWNLYRFQNLNGGLGYQIDFPIVGFNRNWIAITINRYTTAGAFSAGICLAIDYPQARAGVGTGTLFSQATGTHFCSAPAVTYSATEDTLFLVTHLSSAGGTYSVDRITGTPAAPVYTSGGTNTRTGGGWVQPSGNILPQSAPNSGTSACATPCPIETQDAQIRTSPIYRNGFLWYTQTVGLPAGGLTHTAIQWTRITPSTTPAFAEGGRFEDPTATATNGGKWYAYPSLSVNAGNDVMIGFSQFSSAQHPSSGYTFRYGTDAPGTLRDPLIYKAGDDYYHKTFSTATGRNRWGDFTTTQVDPCNDQTLWTLQEYAKTRTGTNDGNTGTNSSRWASWWAAVAGPAPAASVNCPIDQMGAPGATIQLTFRVTNSGSDVGTFSYSVTDANGWGGPVTGTTPPLGSLAFYDVNVNFTIPSDCTPPSDVVTFTAQVVGTEGCFSPVSCQTNISCDLATAALVSRFDAAPASSGVDVTWWSDATAQVRGWNLYRAATETGGWTRVNPSVISMGTGGAFRYHDDLGGAFYRLNAVLLDGSESALSTTRVTTAGGASYAFAIAGGNPFKSRVALRYALPKAEHVEISVFTVAGQRVSTLVDREETPGLHTVDFALRAGSQRLQPGVYMVRMTAGSFRRTVRVVGIE